MAVETPTEGTQRINIEGVRNEISVTLRWKRIGFFQRIFGGNIDLDLGCYCQMTDMQHTLIDCLQFGNAENTDRNRPSKQGCYTMPPFIWHTGNDHGHQQHSQESILINPRGIAMIRKVVVYVFIYDGEPIWNKAKISIDINIPKRGNYTLDIDPPETDKRFCAVCEIDVEDEHTISIRPLLTYHDGHSDCDAYYDWGFKYHKKMN